MNMITIKKLLLMISLSLPLAASAHHSDAGLDMETITGIKGTVKEFVWRNPHVYALIEVQNGNQTVEWDLQLGPTSVISRRGWRRDSLKPGEQVTVRAHVAKNGKPYGVIESVDKPGGMGFVAAGEPEKRARATSLEGKWKADVAATMAYPGGFDGFFNAQLRLTDKGKAEQAAYDPLSKDNPEATCVGRPTPAALVSTSLYLMEIDIQEENELIIIRSEWGDEVRTVYMDGREHPDSSQRFVTGHSIGWWEGDTLIVDTRNFEDHRSPYQIGVPSGAQKHVVERYRLTGNGAHINLEFTLEDPEYIAEPMVHTRLLNYSPHLTFYEGECDEESTSRFLLD